MKGNEMKIHEQFQNEIRKLLERDPNDDDDEPETVLDHYDLGNMSQSDLAFHFFKCGFDAGQKIERG